MNKEVDRSTTQDEKRGEVAEVTAGQAEGKTLAEVSPAGGDELYQGLVKITVLPPIDLEQMTKLETSLQQIENLRLVLVEGSFEEGNKVAVFLDKPAPLLTLLSTLSPVEQVLKQVIKKNTFIQVKLRGKQGAV